MTVAPMTPSPRASFTFPLTVCACTTAQKKSTTAKKSTSSRSGGAKAAPAPRYNHLIWAGVFLFLSVFFFAGYFSVDALLVAPICSLLKGLLGYGYFLLPIALLGGGAVLLALGFRLLLDAVP